MVPAAPAVLLFGLCFPLTICTLGAGLTCCHNHCHPWCWCPCHFPSRHPWWWRCRGCFCCCWRRGLGCLCLKNVGQLSERIHRFFMFANGACVAKFLNASARSCAACVSALVTDLPGLFLCWGNNSMCPPSFPPLFRVCTPDSNVCGQRLCRRTTPQYHADPTIFAVGDFCGPGPWCLARLMRSYHIQSCLRYLRMMISEGFYLTAAASWVWYVPGATVCPIYGVWTACLCFPSLWRGFFPRPDFPLICFLPVHLWR